MRLLLHLLSLCLLMPTLLFASGCLILGQAIGRHSLLGFFDALLSDFLLLMPWGLVALAACLLLLASAGAVESWRRPGAGLVLALGIGSAAVTIWGAGWPREAGQYLFLVPDLLAVIISTWLLLP